MKRRLVILTEIIAPYRIPVFNALAARDDVELHVIFLSETDPGLRQWRVKREEARFSHAVLKSHRLRAGNLSLLLNRGVAEELCSSRPQVILVGGYNYPATWQAQRWARRNGIPFLLWSESNAMDERRKFWLVEAAKRRFIGACDGYVVPGRSSTEYLRSFGVLPERIFIAPNAVDVARFATAARAAREKCSERVHAGRPQRYLLYVGRFVKSKGVFDLLEAYARLPEKIREQVGLVLVGDGEEREELELRSRDFRAGQVVFPGFVQQEKLPVFYAKAEALIFPTHSDPWGLVVNEAMACGLPVIATSVAGSTADMVRDGENGYVVGARDPQALSQAMIRLLERPEERNRMGEHSLEMTKSFTPEAWAGGVARAVLAQSGETHG